MYLLSSGSCLLSIQVAYHDIAQITISSRFLNWKFSSVQFSRSVFATPWITARQASLSITNSRSLLKLMSIKSVMPSSHLILCRPLLLPHPIPPSIRVFSNESALHMRWPKYWSFRFSISPSNEYPGLISFRMDWLDLLAVQGTLKSLLQHHSAKASIFRRSAFFIVPLSHSYMTIGKTIALTRRTSVSFTSLFLQTSSLFSLSYSFALCIAFVTMKELQSANTQHSIFPCSTIQSICIYLLCLVDIKHGSGSWEKCAKLPIVIDSLIKLRMGVRVKSVAQFRWFA